LISAALAYKDAGASRITVVSTHGVFAGDAIQRLRERGLIERVVVTDSHPRALEAAATAEGFVKVVSIAPLLASYLDSY
jgi:ribose-phosphate pyrophosphokinase